ncbi:MAG: hypothetical protein ACOZE5_14170 [Verrucomicrobiota bacterium]
MVAGLALHLFFLIGFRNRLSVLLHRTYPCFACKRGARIILGLESSAPPLAK